MGIGSKLFRQWRICATGLSFLTFMVGSVLLTLIIFPVIRLLPIAPEHKRRKILQLIHGSFKLFINYMLCLKIIDTFETEGLEEIKTYDSYIFVANHPTLIDAIALMSCIPFCNCIVKKSLWQHAYFGRVMHDAGYIANDNATKLIEDCTKSFEVGRPLIIFPEGTRSPAYGLHTFNRGAAQIALRTGTPIVLVKITCDPPTLLKGQPWYAVPERPVRFKLHFHLLPTLPKEIQEKSGFPLKVRMLTQYFEDFFRDRCQVYIDCGHC
jgi:1-acyl-sn-glycerol-3-phosphate acyltransferase